jgi:MATE family multidrug resistance protein
MPDTSSADSLTSKSLHRSILRLAIPNIISNLSVPLLGAVDTALVGHLDNVAYLGAIALGTMIFNFLFWGFGFLRMGTTGITAQAFGRDDKEDSVMTLGRALTVAFVGSVLILLLQYPIEQFSFWLINGTAEVEGFARTYFYIRIYSAPATLAVYALNGWFLGMQNARYPMIVTVALNLLNVVLDVAFIYGLGMDVDGVAWGTLISRYVGFFVAVGLLLYRYRDYLRAFRVDRLMDLAPLRNFFDVNRDIFIRTLCLIFTFSFFTAQSATAGEVVLAANSILLQLWMMVSYGTDGFAFAAESLVGRFIGQDDTEQLRAAVKGTMLWGVAIGVLASLTYALFDTAILRLFTDQEPVIAAALVVFGWTIAGPTVSAFSYIWDGVFIGATATTAMRNTMLVATAVIFVPAYYVSLPYLGVHALWLAMTLFMATRGAVLTWYAPRKILSSPG